MPLLKRQDVELYYELHGSGPPLLLIAGLASDSQSWLPVLPALAERYTVILLDNRGAGRSTQACATSIELMAEDCLALLSHLGLQKVHLVGHSMGGMVALELSLRCPELVQSMVLLASAARNSRRNNLLFADWADAAETESDQAAWFRTILAWILTERFFDAKEMVDAVLTYLRTYPWPQSAAAFRGQVEAIARYDATDRLGQVTVPTCVIAAEQDILLPLQHSEQLARGIPGAELQVVAGAAHSVHSEQPAVLVAAVGSWLERFTKGGCV
jgi:pimeloyl-ACP methyl ester carboxylesterase